MEAIASRDDLMEVYNFLVILKREYPEAYAAFATLISSRRRIGYRNICKLLIGEATPDSLKGGRPNNASYHRFNYDF